MADQSRGAPATAHGDELTVVGDQTDVVQALADLAERYRLLVEYSPDGICVHESGVLVYANPSAVRLVNAKSEAEIIGRPLTDFVHPDSIPAMLTRIASLTDNGKATEPSEMTLNRSDGDNLIVEVVSVRTAWEGRPAYQAIFRDLTGQKAVEAALRRAELYFRTVVASLEEGVIVVSRNGTVESINPAARRMLGVAASRKTALKKHALSLPLYDTAGEQVSDADHPLARTLAGESMNGYVFGVDRADGTRLWLAGNCGLLNPDDPNGPVVASFTDVTSQRAAQEQLEHQATHDPLTGLANRSLVVSRLGAALTDDNAGSLVTVLFIDLDGFKQINDSLGHSIGDEVLRIAGERLRRVVRAEDTIGRLGGDEFVAVLGGFTLRRDVDALIERLRANLAQPIMVNGNPLHVDASIGIVLVHPDDARTPDDVLHDADLAMYEAKASGRGNSTYFTAELRTRNRQRLDAAPQARGEFASVLEQLS